MPWYGRRRNGPVGGRQYSVWRPYDTKPLQNQANPDMFASKYVKRSWFVREDGRRRFGPYRTIICNIRVLDGFECANKSGIPIPSRGVLTQAECAQRIPCLIYERIPHADTIWRMSMLCHNRKHKSSFIICRVSRYKYKFLEQAGMKLD